MKPTAHFLGLLFTALSITALAADTPVPPATAATVAATPPVEPQKAEPAVALPALSSPAVSESNPPNGPAVPAKPFTPLASGKVDDKPSDPDVLELPKMVVKQKPRPRLTPEIMITKQGFGEQLAKQKYSALDQALNKFTLPLFGTSLAERALEDHEREKKQELNLDVLNMVKALDTVDADEAKSLKAAVARP